MILFFILLLPLVSIITLSISKNINVIKFNPIIMMGISLGIIIYFIFDQQIASNGNFDNLYICSIGIVMMSVLVLIALMISKGILVLAHKLLHLLFFFVLMSKRNFF